MPIIVSLSTPISYAYKGEMQEADFIELIAPNFKQIEHFMPVEQAFVAAVTDLSNINTSDSVESIEDEDNKITGSQALVIMMRSSCDMNVIILHCAELFKSGAALLGGEQKITAPILDAMPMDDIKKLVGEYIANFIAISLLNGI